MMITCIYKISNTVNYRLYIGSTINFEKRKSDHIKTLKSGKHANVKLQRFVNKYGLDKLVFTIIKTCEASVLIELEQFYMDYYKCVKTGFNILPIAGRPMCGPMSLAARKKNVKG